MLTIKILDAVTRVEDKEEEDDADCEENGSGTVPKLTCKQASEWVENLRLFFCKEILIRQVFRRNLTIAVTSSSGRAKHLQNKLQ